MVISRHSHRSDYTKLPNEMLRKGLSAEALGVLFYLVSKPTRWAVNVSDIQRTFGFGRKTVYRILAELQSAGYARPLTHRTATGRFTAADYHISDIPFDPSPHAAGRHAAGRHAATGHGEERTDSNANTDSKKNRGGVRAGERRSRKNDAPATMSEALDRLKEPSDDQ